MAGAVHLAAGTHRGQFIGVGNSCIKEGVEERLLGVAVDLK